MIGIARAVSYGINTLRYIKGESEKKRHPEKIYHICNQYLAENMDVMGMWTMMNFRTMNHPGMKNNVFHIEISPSKENTENFTMEDWQQLWKEFVEEFDKQVIYGKDGKVISGKTNIAESMATVWLHKESESGIPHLHAAVCRVDMQGRTNNDHNVDVRAQQAAEAVAIKYGWITAKNVRRRNVEMASRICMEALTAMPFWDWNDYVRRLHFVGYQTKLKRDNDGVVRSYVLLKGRAKYKASELGRGRKLTARNIENTWRALHPQSVNKVLNGDNSKTNISPNHEKRHVNVCQPNHVNHYQDWMPNTSKVMVKLDSHEDVTCYVPKDVMQVFDDMFDYRTEVNWKPLTNLAIAYFAMLAAPDVSSSVGGGSTSHEEWGRKPDEDELEWAFRCAKAAIPQIGRKPRRVFHR